MINHPLDAFAEFWLLFIEAATSSVMFYMLIVFVVGCLVALITDEVTK